MDDIGNACRRHSRNSGGAYFTTVTGSTSGLRQRCFTSCSMGLAWLPRLALLVSIGVCVNQKDNEQDSSNRIGGTLT
jgi:hypothetical protein